MKAAPLVLLFAVVGPFISAFPQFVPCEEPKSRRAQGPSTEVLVRKDFCLNFIFFKWCFKMGEGTQYMCAVDSMDNRPTVITVATTTMTTPSTAHPTDSSRFTYYGQSDFEPIG